MVLNLTGVKQKRGDCMWHFLAFVGFGYAVITTTSMVILCIATKEDNDDDRE